MKLSRNYLCMMVNSYLLPYALFVVNMILCILTNYHREIFPNTSCPRTIGNQLWGRYLLIISTLALVFKLPYLLPWICCALTPMCLPCILWILCLNCLIYCHEFVVLWLPCVLFSIQTFLAFFVDIGSVMILVVCILYPYSKS